MKRFSEQLHKKSQTVKLKKSEQADLRDRIVSYMEYHPLPADMKAAKVSNTKKKAQPTVFTDSFAQYAIPYQMLFKLGSVAAVFVLIVIPFMAERTLPGDTLYAVKVQFNEEVRGTLTWGSYEKVEWETTLLNRRIAEARLLADEGLLTKEVEAGVAAAVQNHSDNARREIEVIRESDADEATIAEIAFGSSLQIQSQAFEEDVEVLAVATGTARTGMLISDVLDKSRADIPVTGTTTLPAYEKLMARVELNTTRVYNLRDSLTDAVDRQILTDVTRRIEDIDRAILEAIELEAEELTELDARLALVDVIERTQKLIVFMTELDIRDEVTVEEVVPVVPTENEISIDKTKRSRELTSAIAQITAAIEVFDNQDVVDKLIVINASLMASQDRLGTMRSYDEFLIESDESLVIAADGLQLLRQHGEGVLEELLPPKELISTTTASTSAEITPDSATSSEEIAVEVTEVEPEVESEAIASTTISETVSENTQEIVDELP